MNLVILGAGESGIGAALLARQKEYNVLVSDGGRIKPPFRSELEQYQIPFEEGGHSFERLDQADLIVKSPGIPDSADAIRYLQQHDKQVISEIEFGFMHCRGRVVGITGSNGKTTTTRICYSLFSGGLPGVKMAGNVGRAFCRSLAEGDAEWWVLELSSFQLEGIRTFRPDIAILLNITPDHLDRYGGSFRRYGQAKMRITEQMRSDDLLIYYGGDARLKEFVLEAAPRCRILEVGGGILGVEQEVLLGGMQFHLPPETLPGRHNQINAACAIAAAVEAGIDEDAIQQALEAFVNAPHRMENVATVNGVQYINDSKATNVDAVVVALESLRQPVIWIAGGQDKGNDYAELRNLVRTKVKALICLGLDNTRLKEAFSTEVDTIRETTSAGEAVRLAASLAKPGDAVILSPACASFDLFENYEHRGDMFKQAVRAIQEKKT